MPRIDRPFINENNLQIHLPKKMELSKTQRPSTIIHDMHNANELFENMITMHKFIKEKHESLVE